MEQTLEKTTAQILVPAIAVTDGELLMRFAQHGDEQAFAALVEKHGRLVWAVCWQVLREHHAIEDAFQSTFFILAKRARSIRSCDSLCSWLYRVAYRTALRARMSIKARPLSALGTEADTMEEWSEFDEKLRAIEQDEQRAALLEELHAIPEKYQQVLALCYLEGKTRRVIADELGCSIETVKGRLARGRQVLRHRLIRRGVSLSFAMAAMTVPVKSAAAAVTPSLIGITVTGATAWAAGALGTAKIASGVGAAKATATASSQVIHLAHQGTVAMTIASFAKPAIVAVALLGAVSGTLAVDSSDESKGRGETQVIDLAAGAEGESLAAADAASDLESPVVTVAAAEEVTIFDGKADKNKKPKPKTWTVEDLVVEKKRIPAPSRVPQPVKVRTPAVPADVFVPAVPPMPPAPVVAPLDVHAPRFNLKLQLKLAALEAHVSELMLESKNLEIESFKAEGNRKAELLKASQETLIKAEAEKLKIQLEQQKEQIKALEEAVREQAEQVGKRAAEIAADAEAVAAYAEKAAGAAEAQAAKQAKHAAQQAAQAAKWQIQERAVIFDQASGQLISPNPYTAVSDLPTWEQSIEAQQGAMSLKPGDRIQIEIDTDRSNFEEVYTVEPMGTVALGAAYGRAEVKGLSVIEAEEVIKEVISQVTKDAKVQVTYLHPTVTYGSPYVPPNNAGEFRYAPASNVEAGKDTESK